MLIVTQPSLVRYKMKLVRETIFGLLFLFNKVSLELGDENTIALLQGKVQGTNNLIDGYRSYLGIPYATVKERYQVRILRLIYFLRYTFAGSISI